MLNPTPFTNADNNEISFAAWYNDIIERLEVNEDHYPNDTAKKAFVVGWIRRPAKQELLPYVDRRKGDPILKTS
jgi:hypothetical protein